jgi:two-component system sensor kinase FixL
LQDFAYVASHDLQEPLRKIQAFGDRLLTKHAKSRDDERRDYLHRLVSAAARMSSMISDLLAYARVTTQS